MAASYALTVERQKDPVRGSALLGPIPSPLMLDVEPVSAAANAAEVVAGSCTSSASEEHSSLPRLWPRASALPRVTPGDPATRVVTDFAHHRPLTVTEDRSIDDALREMVCAGIRALFVVRQELVIGLISSYDIEGRRPLDLLRSSGGVSRGEIAVGQIMTPWDAVPTLDWQSVCAARVRQIEAYFRNTSAMHVVLLEHWEESGLFVRGLLSRKRLERELGRPL